MKDFIENDKSFYFHDKGSPAKSLDCYYYEKHAYAGLNDQEYYKLQSKLPVDVHFLDLLHYAIIESSVCIAHCSKSEV